ncbi:MAG TPA: hypothetical protein VFH78_10855, partial [Candidatus Thermoplasmatota archaeon]|nr:hypothetical protein [Candidatus Thermoplasmatota archaeon]
MARRRRLFAHPRDWRGRRTRFLAAVALAALLATAFFATAARHAERAEAPLERSGARADARSEGVACIDARLEAPLEARARIGCDGAGVDAAPLAGALPLLSP